MLALLVLFQVISGTATFSGNCTLSGTVLSCTSFSGTFTPSLPTTTYVIPPSSPPVWTVVPNSNTPNIYVGTLISGVCMSQGSGFTIQGTNLVSNEVQGNCILPNPKPAPGLAWNSLQN